MKRIVILGAGTAGTMMANRLSKQHRRELRQGELSITVVDQDERHVYQPGLLFVPFGIYQPEDIVKPRKNSLPGTVRYIQSPIERVAVEEDTVYLVGDRKLPYDVLVVASGTQIAPEETEGLTGPGWQEKMFEFYTLEGATALARAMERWEGGNLVVNIVDMPIKCPVAPIEFVFLADWYFTKTGRRDKVNISLVTPLESAFTKPTCATALSYLLDDKNISLVTEFNAGEVDGPAGKLISWDERTVDFDLLVSVPLHGGADFVGRSPGLGDDMNFVLTDPNTLQASCKENVFAIGDATNVPTSKAGSVAHFEADVLTENIGRYLGGEGLKSDFDGHANCFIETGFNKALLVDFNYEVEPLPGTFPLPVVGPLALLKESRLNHWGKMLFRWVYWNMLLPGRDIPLVTTQMTMRGKRVIDLPPMKPAAIDAAESVDESTRVA